MGKYALTDEFHEFEMQSAVGKGSEQGNTVGDNLTGMATGLVTVPWEFGQALVSGDPERIGKATVDFETALYGGRNTKVDPKAMLQAGKQGVAKASGVVKEGLQSAANAGKQLIKNTAEKGATKIDDLKKDKAVTNIRAGQQNALNGGTNALIPDEFNGASEGRGGTGLSKPDKLENTQIEGPREWHDFGKLKVTHLDNRKSTHLFAMT